MRRRSQVSVDLDDVLDRYRGHRREIDDRSRGERASGKTSGTQEVPGGLEARACRTSSRRAGHRFRRTLPVGTRAWCEGWVMAAGADRIRSDRITDQNDPNRMPAQGVRSTSLTSRTRAAPIRPTSASRRSADDAARRGPLGACAGGSVLRCRRRSPMKPADAGGRVRFPGTGRGADEHAESKEPRPSGDRGRTRTAVAARGSRVKRLMKKPK